ncbi:hypothetical protein EVAR_87222_1 [Eumeta japonica]|uniref:Uncharacterized protein n=1 Tax=Eumeta variegata TaxID=151549 RepID=A0A4C1ZQS5_EUMVA|nr:hypothetical protein EVAR_87222_1 [Eumeta japonica]
MNETRSRDLNSLMNKNTSRIKVRSFWCLLFQNQLSCIVPCICVNKNLSVVIERDERQAERTGAHAGRAPAAGAGSPLDVSRQKRDIVLNGQYNFSTCRFLLRLGVTLKSVTLGNVTMSHRTREARRMPCVSLPLNYDRSAARS